MKRDEILHLLAAHQQELARFEVKSLDAMVRNFIISEEALRYIPPEIEARCPDLPWHDMRGLRHIKEANVLWLKSDLLSSAAMQRA
jgi:uncharacterized protein with HEPN domain